MFVLLLAINVAIGEAAHAVNAQARHSDTYGQRADIPEYMRYPDGFKYVPGVQYFGLGIPRPIAPDEWEKYAQALELSEAQSAAAAKLYNEHRRTDWDLRMAKAQPLWDRCSEVRALGDGHSDRRSAEALAALFEDRDSILPAILGSETAFFDSLVPLLAEVQLPKLRRVQNLRARHRLSETSVPFPGHNYDLEWALLDLRDRGLDLTPKDAKAVDALLDSYSTELTALMRDLDAAVRKKQPRAVLVLATLAEVPRTPEDLPRRQELTDEYIEENSKPVRIARRALEANQRYVRDIAEMLSPASGAELHKTFQERVYPVVYPNPFDLAAVFHSAAQVQSLNDEQDAQIAGIFEIYSSTTRSVSEEMVRAYIDWSETTASRMGYLHEQYEKYASRMNQFREALRSASERAIAELRSLLNEDQLRALELSLSARKKAMAAFDARIVQLQSQGRSWPLPYD